MIRHTRTWASSNISPMKLLVRHSSLPPIFLKYLNDMYSVEHSQLNNGLNVVSQSRECYNACIGYFFDSGSRYELPHENGISHFFEHLAFKGTRTRSKTDLDEQISGTGARFNCFTTREMVCFYAECLSQHVPTIFEILSDCLFDNLLSASEIELQRSNVYLEMLQHDQNTKTLVDDYIHATAFQGTSLAQTVMGPSCNLHNFNPETILCYLNRILDANRIVLAAVGGVSHEKLFQLAMRLENLPSGKCVASNFCRYTGSEMTYRNDNMPVAHVTIAVEGPPVCSPDHIVMSLAASIVGGWDKSQAGGLDLSSRVARSASTFQLCESYKALNIAYKDTGLWGVHFVSPKIVVDDMVAVVQDEWMRLCTMISEGEVDRAKAELITEILMNHMSATNTCMSIGRGMLYNRFKATLYNRLCAIDTITVQDIKGICSKYLYDKCPAVTAIGSTECLPDYTRMRAGMYWLRY